MGLEMEWLLQPCTMYHPLTLFLCSLKVRKMKVACHNWLAAAGDVRKLAGYDKEDDVGNVEGSGMGVK